MATISGKQAGSLMHFNLTHTGSQDEFLSLNLTQMEELHTNSSVFEESFWRLFEDKYLRHSFEWTIALAIVYMLIIVIGTVGNCIVILIVIFRPPMRTVTNMFLMNLAVADLFVIVFCMPATLLGNIFKPWMFGTIMCKCVAYIQGVSVCASAYSLVAISLDRCKAICKPLKINQGISKLQALIIIALIWVVASLATLPWALIFNVVVDATDGLSYCLETWGNEQNGKIYFLFANLLLCYCFPLILISISNIIIWYHVNNRSLPQDTATLNLVKDIHRRTRHGVKKMLGIITFAYLLSWLPLYVLVTRIKFAENISEYEQNLLAILMPFAQWLGSTHSCVNPILYSFFNRKFCNMFKSLLPSWMPFICSNDKKMNVQNKGRIQPVSNEHVPLKIFSITLRFPNYSVGGKFGRNIESNKIRGRT